MGKVQQAAGGGKITTENLIAENIKDGVTVTVRQGSKTVQSVTGTLQGQGRVITIYEYSGSAYPYYYVYLTDSSQVGVTTWDALSDVLSHIGNEIATTITWKVPVLCFYALAIGTNTSTTATQGTTYAAGDSIDSYVAVNSHLLLQFRMLG